MNPATEASRQANRQSNQTDLVHLALPKGRMHDGVVELLAAAGIRVRTDARAYRPKLSVPGYETKLLKPQNIVGMLEEGSRDVGFAGADWVAEKGADLVELLDTGLDPVRIVAAAPKSLVIEGCLQKPAGRELVVSSEYTELSRQWMDANTPGAHFVRSYGATEVFPPEDADVIVDNTATGATLVANGLTIIGEVMRSSTRLFANRLALTDPTKRDRIADLVLCLRAVLEARSRAMVELNVSKLEMQAVVDALPCMRQPTVSTLNGDNGYAIRAAVPRQVLPTLIPTLKALGASDIVVSACEQIVP